MNDKEFLDFLLNRFKIERKKFDRTGVYAYTQRPNMIGMYQTVRPENVEEEMNILIGWYFRQKVDVAVLAEFHAKI